MGSSQMGKTFNVALAILTLLMGLSASSLAREAPPPVARSVLLAADQAAPMVQQCSRAVPRITGSWIPTAKDIKRLERDLVRIKGQRASACCTQSAKMDDASKYFRQYAGVVRGGRKLIYVNGFLHPPVGAPEEVNWKLQPVIVCGGGTDNWGVLYDPQTRAFSQLAFNGEG